MAKQIVPPVTEQELLAFLADSKAATLAEIARELWVRRDDAAHPDAATERPARPTGTPIVRSYHVRPVLDALLERNLVVSAVGAQVATLGGATLPYRDEITYYTTAEKAERHRQEAAEREADAAADRALAGELERVFTGRALRAEVGQPDEIHLVLTAEDTRHLLRAAHAAMTEDTR